MSKPKVQHQVITQKTKDQGHPPQAKVLSLPGYLLKIFICLFLIGATLAVFWPLKNNEFVNLDDGMYVTENLHVQAGLTLKGLSWAFTTTRAGNWHPLTWLSHMLDCQLYGLKPAGHHLTSLLLHIVNTLLLFLVLKRMTGALWGSSFVAALFALHPLHVESVAWVAERKDVLSTFFWMLTMWTYVRYAERPRLNRYLLVLLSFALGLMSKPMLVTLPFVLLLLDYWPLGRFQFGKSSDPPNSPTHKWSPTGKPVVPSSRLVGANIPYQKTNSSTGKPLVFLVPGSKKPQDQRSFALRLVLGKVPFFALAGVSSFLTFFAQQRGGAVGSLEAFPLESRMANALVSYVSYIGKMIWPHHLAVLYPYQDILPMWQVTGAGLLLVGLSALVILAARRRPYLVVGWLWYLGTLVPVIGLVQVGIQAMADRYTYVPLISLFIMMAMGVPDILAGWRHRRIVMAISAGLLLSIFMIVTWSQVRHWQNDFTLFGHTVEVTSNNSLIHNNLGVVLARQGKTQEAIGHYTEALRIDPHYVDAHYNLGLALVRKGKTQEAIAHYTEALRIKPDFAEAHNNLGAALAQQGRVQEAIAHFAEALRLRPDDAEVYSNLGNILSEQGRIEEAITHYAEALRIKPDYAEAHFSLGLTYLMIGNRDSAMEEYKILKTINRDMANTLLQKIFK
jgi:Flp pilus assembly protein TadD